MRACVPVIVFVAVITYGQSKHPDDPTFPLPKEVFVAAGNSRTLVSFGNDTSDLSIGPAAHLRYFTRISSRRSDGTILQSEICLADLRARTFRVVIRPAQLPTERETSSILFAAKYAQKENAIVFLSSIGATRSGLWIYYPERRQSRLLGSVKETTLASDVSGDNWIIAAAFGKPGEPHPDIGASFDPINTWPAMTLIRVKDLLVRQWTGSPGSVIDLAERLPHLPAIQQLR